MSRRELPAEPPEEAAIEVERSPVALLNMAALHVEREEYERAGEVLAEFSPADLEEESRPMYYQLEGYIHLQQGKLTKARQAIQEGLKLHPDNVVLKEELERVEAWRWLRRGQSKYKRLEERRRKRYLSVHLCWDLLGGGLEKPDQG